MKISHFWHLDLFIQAQISPKCREGPYLSIPFYKENLFSKENQEKTDIQDFCQYIDINLNNKNLKYFSFQYLPIKNMFFITQNV